MTSLHVSRRCILVLVRYFADKQNAALHKNDIKVTTVLFYWIYINCSCASHQSRVLCCKVLRSTWKLTNNFASSTFIRTVGLIPN